MTPEQREEIRRQAQEQFMPRRKSKKRKTISRDPTLERNFLCREFPGLRFTAPEAAEFCGSTRSQVCHGANYGIAAGKKKLHFYRDAAAIRRRQLEKSQ